MRKLPRLFFTRKKAKEMDGRPRGATLLYSPSRARHARPLYNRVAPRGHPLVSQHIVSTLAPVMLSRTRKSLIYSLVSLWFVCMLVIAMLANIPARSNAPIPYTVTITSNNFRVPLITLATDDVSDASNARFSLQNGTSLWYGITLSSTPTGIVPTAANLTNDLVSTTFLGSTPLLPPAQVLPFDSWNGTYHFETLKLKAAFSGPGQQVQIGLSPMEPHAITLDVLTLLLQLLGQKQSNVQIGLLETGVLQDIFSSVSSLKDFNTLTENYSQALLTAQDSAKILPYAYACAQSIASLLSDGSEQSTLADVLWKIQGKAVPRTRIVKTITDFTQTQFGLAVEGFINNYVGTLGGMFSQSGIPTVILQTISTATPSVTPSPSVIPSPTSTSTPVPVPTASPTTVPTIIPQAPIITPKTLTPIR